jgi:hypothetical protein
MLGVSLDNQGSSSVAALASWPNDGSSSALTKKQRDPSIYSNFLVDK